VKLVAAFDVADTLLLVVICGCMKEKNASSNTAWGQQVLLGPLATYRPRCDAKSCYDMIYNWSTLNPLDAQTLIHSTDIRWAVFLSLLIFS